MALAPILLGLAGLMSYAWARRSGADLGRARVDYELPDEEPPQGYPAYVRKEYGKQAYQQFLACRFETARNVRRRLGTTKLPDHIQKFGEFMIRMSGRHVEADDVIKAYLITVASIRRRAIPPHRLQRSWPDAPFTPASADWHRLPKKSRRCALAPTVPGAEVVRQGANCIRPEDAMAALLRTPEGRRLVRSIRVGALDAKDVDVVVRRFEPFGLTPALRKQIRHAPELAKRAAEVRTTLRGANRSEWLDFVAKHVHGVGYAKAGFLASLLGRGDLTTADAREIELWAPNLRLSEIHKETVLEMNKRLQQLRIELPDEMRPFYEHLTHHMLWDVVGQTEVLHDEIQACMSDEAVNGLAQPPLRLPQF